MHHIRFIIDKCCQVEMKKHKKFFAQKLVVECLCITFLFLLTSCNGLDRLKLLPGASYVAPLGKPRAYSILWSPRDLNRFLVSASGVGVQNPQVHLLDNRAKTILADNDYGVLKGESWSPDGRYVVVTADMITGGDMKSGIWIIDLQDNLKELFLEEYGSLDWSPDGKTFALLSVNFAPGESRKVSLSLINIESKTREFVYENENALVPLGVSWSFDGNQLALSFSDKQGGANGVYPSDIYVLNLENQRLIQLTFDGNSSFPQWSPTGNIIAYMKYAPQEIDATHSINLIRADGTCDTKLPILSRAISPTWSPDGKQLAYIGQDGIYALDLKKIIGVDIYQDLCKYRNR